MDTILLASIFRNLVREDQKRRAEAHLDALLIRGLESPASEWTKDDADHIKKVVRERLASKETME